MGQVSRCSALKLKLIVSQMFNFTIILKNLAIGLFKRVQSFCLGIVFSINRKRHVYMWFLRNPHYVCILELNTYRSLVNVISIFPNTYRCIVVLFQLIYLKIFIFLFLLFSIILSFNSYYITLCNSGIGLYNDFEICSFSIFFIERFYSYTSRGSEMESEKAR